MDRLLRSQTVARSHRRGRASGQCTAGAASALQDGTSAVCVDQSTVRYNLRDGGDGRPSLDLWHDQIECTLTCHLDAIDEVCGKCVACLIQICDTVEAAVSACHT